MDFELSSEQKMAVEATRRMVQGQIQPILDAHPKDKPLPKQAALQILGHCAELGITAARVPEEGGGSGMKMLDYGLITEQLPVVAAGILQPQETTIARLYFGSTEAQRRKFLPDLIAGKRITCTATTEPDVGSDPRGVRTRLREDGDSVVINGNKLWISNASISDVVNVTCRTEGGEPGRDLTRVIVDRQESPYASSEVDVIGLNQGHLGEIVFDNCRVPRFNVLGNSGDAARVLTLTWLANRPLLGLGAVHCAQKAFELACTYAGTRKQFGRLIGGYQIVQQDLADVQTAIVASRLLCYNALAALDRGERANGLSAMAKRFAVESCDRAIALAMRVHGAMGLSRELGLEQLARDVRMLCIPDGTPGILALIQGREITGLDPFRDGRPMSRN
jgi:alkylation response protein AidB-like acyl-CoA dehydrogenase